MLSIDGSQGEGGGQILRSALALSMIASQPFAVENIRAKRKKPGLMRQHLTCVLAAAEISAAKVTGAELGSRTVTFAPGEIRGGDYAFAIGTAGATTLVFQTVLPALLYADAPSRLKLRGGTHNPLAPSFDFIDRAFLPILGRMGASVEIALDRHGFYPAGGGAWHATITPAGKLKPLVLDEAGARVSSRIFADVANIGYEVARREAAEAASRLSWPPETAQARTVKADGPGNVLSIEIAHEHVTEIFTGIGERGRSAEAVAEQTVREAREYLTANVPVGPHLADQLVLALALAGAGSFVTMAPTQHTRTNIAVIEKFLPVEIALDDLGCGRWRVTVET